MVTKKVDKRRLTKQFYHYLDIFAFWNVSSYVEFVNSYFKHFWIVLTQFTCNRNNIKQIPKNVLERMGTDTN